MSPLCAQKLARLQTIVAERAAWADQLAQVKRLHSWLLEVEHLLDESLVPEGEEVSNGTVGSRLDSWRERMATQLTDGSLSELERACLTAFLQVLSNLRPHLVQCYDREDFPRTVPRHGAQHSRPEARSIAASVGARTGTPICCATAAVWHTRPGGSKIRPIESFWNSASPGLTVSAGEHCDGRPPSARREQLTRFRFRHKRQALLASLEERWATAAQSASLP